MLHSGEENESRTDSLKDGETRATKSVNKVDGSTNDFAYGEENESRTESLKDGETRATKSVNKVDNRLTMLHTARKMSQELRV
jgi:hypothetical protein